MVLACKHWIFDMDGTLTHAIHDFEAIRAQLGLKPGEMILEALAAMPEDQARELDRKLFEIELDLANQGTAQNGADELLEALVRNGCQTGIVTRNSEKLAEITLQACGLSDYFARENIVGREHCEPKPHPAGVHYLLNKWQASPRDTVIVGDFVFDLQAGRSAGIYTIHFDVGNTDPWPESRDLHVSCLQDLARRFNHAH